MDQKLRAPDLREHFRDDVFSDLAEFHDDALFLRRKWTPHVGNEPRVDDALHLGPFKLDVAGRFESRLCLRARESDTDGSNRYIIHDDTDS